MYFRNKKYYIYGKKDYFYTAKLLPYLIDENIYFIKCKIISATYAINLYILEYNTC